MGNEIRLRDMVMRTFIVVAACAAYPSEARAQTARVTGLPEGVQFCPRDGAPERGACAERLRAYARLIDARAQTAEQQQTRRLGINQKLLSDFQAGEGRLINDFELVVFENGVFDGVVNAANGDIVVFQPPGVARFGDFPPGTCLIARRSGTTVQVIRQFNQSGLPESDAFNPETTGGGGRFCADPDGCRPTPGFDPIILDLGAKGFEFTSAEDGVLFRFDPDADPVRTGWTAAGSGDAFLVLDRNGNGTIDDGRELFGDETLRRNGREARHGFQALRDLDFPTRGGNSNGYIDPLDAAYRTLKLWTDVNHDGISQPSELATLQERGVAFLSVSYRRGSGEDENGNILKLESKAYLSNGRGFEEIDTVDVFFDAE